MQRALLFIVCLIGCVQLVFSQNVSLQYDTSLPQGKYAAERLAASLSEQGYTLNERQADYVVNLALDSVKLESEAFAISREGNKLTVTGGDPIGIIYGSLSLIEDLQNGILLREVKAKSESPNLSFRAIKFNLPWDSYRHSEALDQHTETCKDINFWEAFLDMMAENRFNALTLWNLHPFTFMIKPRNFPEASPFTDEEMKAWQELYSIGVTHNLR